MQRCKKNVIMTNINNPNWERLWQVIELSGMTINAFARHIGLARSKTLYQIKNDKNGISRNVADCVVARFPQISKPWLLTGYGAMYVSDDDNSARQISFYRCDIGEIGSLHEKRPESYMFLPQIKAADFAVCYSGDDMAPSIEKGSVLILQETDAESMILGEEYVIIGRKLITLRKVRVGADDAVLRLVAVNSAEYDDMTIRRADIEKVYAIRGKLTIKN